MTENENCQSCEIEYHETKPVSAALTGALDKLQRAIQLIPPEVRDRRQKEAEERFRRRDQEQFENLIAESRAPQRQINNRDVDRSGPWGVAEKRVNELLGTGCFVALIGTRGCGKTQLAVEAIRTSSTAGKRTRYCTATEFFMEIKASYDSEIRSEKDVVNEFSRPALLAIDEIGQRSENEWENRLLFELLNRRYNALKDTIVIGNQTVEAFGRSLGPSLISRMQETGGLIECNWPSYRK